MKPFTTFLFFGAFPQPWRGAASYLPFVVFSYDLLTANSSVLVDMDGGRSTATFMPAFNLCISRALISYSKLSSSIMACANCVGNGM